MFIHQIMLGLLLIFYTLFGHRLERWWLNRGGWRRGFQLIACFALTAAAAVCVGTGTTIVFGTTSWTSNLKSVTWSGIKRKALDSSYMGTTQVAGPNTTTTGFGSMTFIPSSLSDPGSLKFVVQFNPDKIPLIDSASETVTVTFPKSNGMVTAGPKWAGTGFVTDFEVTDQMEEIMTATITVKMSGNIAWTTGS